MRGDTVRRHLALKAVPIYERKVKRPTKLAPYKAYLRERQTAAQPNWIPASVLHSEIVERGCLGGLSQSRTFIRSLRPTLPIEAVIRFDTEMGKQLLVDWVEFRKGSAPLHAFCATMGFSRASYVEFVSDMKVATLIDCHEHAFAAFDGVPRRSCTTT
jgi:transposase